MSFANASGVPAALWFIWVGILLLLGIISFSFSGSVQV